MGIIRIPDGFTAVLAGHIHQFQVLAPNLKGGELPAPIFYPGSIERTSFPAKNEQKGYLILEFRTALRHQIIKQNIAGIRIQAFDRQADI